MLSIPRDAALNPLPDKTALNQAALFGILKDLDLVEVTNVGGKTVNDTRRYSYGKMFLLFSWACRLTIDQLVWLFT